MHRRRTRRAKPHHIRLRKSRFITSRNKDHPRAMKTQMAEPDFTKEFPPDFSGHDGLLEARFAPLLDQATKERPQFWRKRNFGCAFFLTFRAQPQNVAGEIYVAQGENSLTKTAPLFPRNFVANSHPL